ncbi:MAG: hypothetical protein WKF50_09310 [Nocardioides sp.]
MTEKLKQLMHERAESVDFATPDLDAMTRSGDRRVRRRRGLTVVGGIAAVAVLGGVAFSQLGGREGGDPVVVTTAPEAASLTWVTGSVLHTAEGEENDLGFTVRGYVRTSAGYVLSDREGTVWSWVDGSATEVGRTDARHPHLVSDDESTLAGWVDGSAAQPGFVVLDQDTGEVTRYDEQTSPGMGDLADEPDPAFFAAIDDGSAYWRDQRGAVVVDLASGNATVIDAGAENGFALGDMEDGLIASTTDTGTTIRGVTGDQIRELEGVYGSLGTFSQDARYYTSDADEPQVYDVANGERLTFDLGGRAFAAGYEWLDAHTIAMIAAEKPRDDSVAELLACEVPAGTCELVVELGTFEEVAGTLALPTGTSTGE